MRRPHCAARRRPPPRYAKQRRSPLSTCVYISRIYLGNDRSPWKRSKAEKKKTPVCHPSTVHIIHLAGVWTCEHPVLRTHPETGGTTLNVSPGFTRSIVGLAAEDSEKLLRKLHAQAGAAEYTCRFRWEDGSLAFYDNRACQHCAVAVSRPLSRPCLPAHSSFLQGWASARCSTTAKHIMGDALCVSCRISGRTRGSSIASPSSMAPTRKRSENGPSPPSIQHAKNDHFTKTGSGQTLKGNPRKRGPFIRSLSTSASMVWSCTAVSRSTAAAGWRLCSSAGGSSSSSRRQSCEFG